MAERINTLPKSYGDDLGESVGKAVLEELHRGVKSSVEDFMGPNRLLRKVGGEILDIILKGPEVPASDEVDEEPASYAA